MISGDICINDMICQLVYRMVVTVTELTHFLVSMAIHSNKYITHCSLTTSMLMVFIFKFVLNIQDLWVFLSRAFEFTIKINFKKLQMCKM